MLARYEAFDAVFEFHDTAFVIEAEQDPIKANPLEYAKLKKSCVTSELPVGTVYQVQMGYYEYLDLMS